MTGLELGLIGVNVILAGFVIANHTKCKDNKISIERIDNTVGFRSSYSDSINDAVYKLDVRVDSLSHMVQNTKEAKAERAQKLLNQAKQLMDEVK